MLDIKRIGQQLNSDDKQQRLEAIKALYQSNHPKAIKLLQWAARNDPDVQLQTAASRAAKRLQEQIRSAEAAKPDEPVKLADAQTQKPIDEETSQLLDELLSDDEPSSKTFVTEESLQHKSKRVASQSNQSQKVTFWDMGLAVITMIAFVFVMVTIGAPWVTFDNLTLSNGKTFGQQIDQHQNLLYDLLAYDYGLERVDASFSGFDLFTISNNTDAPYEALFFSINDEYLNTLRDEAGINLPREYFSRPIDMLVIIPVIVVILSLIIMLISGMILLSRFTGTNSLMLFALSPLLAILSPLVRMFGASIFWVISLILIIINGCLLVAFRLVGAGRFIEESIRVMQLDVQPYAVGNLIGVGYWQTWILMVVLFSICCVALGMKHLPKD